MKNGGKKQDLPLLWSFMRFKNGNVKKLALLFMVFLSIVPILYFGLSLAKPLDIFPSTQESFEDNLNEDQFSAGENSIDYPIQNPTPFSSYITNQPSPSVIPAPQPSSYNEEIAQPVLIQQSDGKPAKLKLHPALIYEGETDTDIILSDAFVEVASFNISNHIKLDTKINLQLSIKNATFTPLPTFGNAIIKYDIQPKPSPSSYAEAQLTPLETNAPQAQLAFNKSKTGSASIGPQLAGSRLYVATDKTSYNSGDQITVYVDFYNDERVSQEGYYAVVLLDASNNIVKWVHEFELKGFDRDENHFTHTTSYSTSEGKFLWAYAYIENSFNSNDWIGAISAQFGVGLTLNGRFVDENGNPIKARSVKLTSCSDSVITSATTNSNGEFVLKTGNKGSYKLKLEMPYGTVTILIDGIECYSYPAGFFNLGNIGINTKTSFEGTLVDENGNAVKDAVVRWTDCSDNNVVSSTTDSQGKFRLVANVGSYKLKITYNGVTYTFLAGGNECFFYNSNYQDTIQIRTRAHIYGKIKNELGANLNGAAVKLTTCSGSEVISTTTNPSGDFSLRPYAGNYNLRIVFNGYTYEVPADCPFFYPQDYNFDTLQITAKVHLSGRLTNEYNQAMKSSTVKFTDCSNNLINSAATNSSGGFDLTASPGSYKLKVVDAGEEFTFIINGKECNAYDPGYGAIQLQIPVDTHILGKIVNEGNSPFSNIPVKLKSCTSSTTKTGYTNSAGNFMVNATPGNYKILVGMPYADLTLLVNNNECNYYSRGYIEFSTLTLYKNFYLTGYFYDLENRPVSNVGLEAHYCTGGLKASTSTSGSGKFSLSADAGYYKLKIVLDGKRFKLQDSQGNECFLLFGPIDTGVININPNPDCSQYNYFCYNNDIKLFDCRYDAGNEGCICSGERCTNGCTPGLTECNSGVLGTIKLDVDDLAGTPIQYATVNLEGNLYGWTDAAGKLDVKTPYGYRDVSVSCPTKEFCGKKTEYVDGTKYVYFDCDCILDSDDDWVPDKDERKIGTDPFNKDSNLFAALSSNRVAVTCFDLRPLFSAFLSFSQTAALVNTLNVSSVAQSNEFAEGNIEPLLERAGIDLKNNLTNGRTLTQSVTHSSEITGLQKGSYYFMIIKDSETGATSIFSVSANCAGTIIGFANGVVYGLKDDVEFLAAILQGLWHYATHLNEIAGIWGQVTSLFSGALSIFGNLFGTIEAIFSGAGRALYEFSLSIFEKGQKFNLFTNNEEDYLSFQLGFYQGYTIGYVGEQTVLLGKVAKAIQAFKVGAKFGQFADNAAEILAKITTKFSGSVADAMRNLKVWEVAKLWPENEINGLARIAKNREARWINQQSESYLKEISGKVDKLSNDMAQKFGKTICLSCKDAEEIINSFIKHGFDNQNVRRILSEGSDEAKQGLALAISEMGGDANKLRNMLEKLGGNYNNLKAYSEIIGRTSKPGSLWNINQLDDVANNFIKMSSKKGGQNAIDETLELVSKFQLDWNPNAIQRMVKFVDAGMETTSGVSEGSKILESFRKINGENVIKDIFEDSSKTVRKIPESSTPTPDFQIDNIFIEAKTLEQGQDIADAFNTAFRAHFERGGEQLKNLPKKITHIDVSARKFSATNPTQFIDIGSNTGLQKLWNDAKNAGTSIDELWLKLKDSGGTDRLWRFYEENGVLKGVVIQ